MHLQTIEHGAAGMDLEEIVFNPPGKIQTNRLHVADQLSGRFLKCKVEAVFATLASGIGEMCRQAGFAGSCGAGYQDSAATIKPFAAEHGVEARNAAGDAFAADCVQQSERSHRQDTKTVLIDEKRIFVGTVRRTAVFDDAQAAGGNLVCDAVIEKDDAVGDVLFEATAGE